MLSKKIEIIGLLLDVLGAGALAFSINIFNPATDCSAGTVVQICGNSIYLSVQNDLLLYLGLGAIIIGFVLQLIAKFIKK